MRCPFCSHTETQVKDSRPSEDGRVIRRRRECYNCNRRFTTFERFQVQQLLVTKRDGVRELFDRDKLTKALLIALRKRPVDQTSIARLVSEIEQQLTESGRHEIPTNEIGDIVMKKLQKLDYVGFVRYASVYNEFKDADDFRSLIGAKAENDDE